MEHDQSSDDDLSFMVGSLGLHSVESDDIIWVTPRVNDKDLKMELDTGSAKSIISHAEYQSMYSNTPLRSTDVRLKTYTNERVSPLGVMDVQLQYKGQSCSAPLYVLPGNGTALFGREWLNLIKLDWHAIKSMSVQSVKQQLKTLVGYDSGQM